VATSQLDSRLSPRRSESLRGSHPLAAGTSGASGSLLFADDVAGMIGMTKDWVYAETRAGRIPHVKLGRYYRYRSESIEAWLRAIEDGAGHARHQVRRRR
jgi:excisionase family DNA binding protein